MALMMPGEQVRGRSPDRPDMSRPFQTFPQVLQGTDANNNAAFRSGSHLHSFPMPAANKKIVKVKPPFANWETW